MNLERVQNATLDALAVLLAADRGDAVSIDLMFSTYRPGTPEFTSLISALIANALCAVRVAASQAGTTPENMLAAVAATVRGATTDVE